MDKGLILGIAPDFEFKIIKRRPSETDTPVAVSLPVCLADAALPGPDHKDQLSVLAGAFKRIGANPILPPLQMHKVVKKIRRFARRHIHSRFERLDSDDILPTLEWIDQINHPEARKEELRKAYYNLVANGLIRDQTLDLFDSNDPAATGSFVKDEKYPDRKFPRWINASADEFKVLYGPVSDAISKKLFSNPVFIKKVPVAKRAEVICDLLYEVNSEYVANDYTSFEAHFDTIRMQIGHDFISYMIGGLGMKNFSEHFRIDDIIDGILERGFVEEVLEGVLRNRRFCEMRNFGVVSVIARRMSGEMDTSSMNGYTNYVMTQYVGFLKTNGQEDTFPAVVEGDDSLCRYPLGCAPDDALMASLGWNAKIEVHSDLATAGFCGLVFDQVEKVSVCNVLEAVQKLWTNRRYVRASHACLMSLLRSKGLSFACEYGNVPIIGPLAHRILYLTRHVNVRQSVIDQMDQYDRERYLLNVDLKVWQRPPAIGERTRRLVERLYGIDYDIQIRLEERISKMNLGFFSLPELAFEAVQEETISHYCDIQVNRPSVYNLSGRRELVDRMQAVLNRDLVTSRKLGSMLKQLEYLVDPRITN